ncbi:hypothetical protein Mp_8g17590 [Marchantia polymorpha subsp. ruderalis]|uniref:Uncharacterized protein n=1 Tax=Marchantia polymorpha TaxID=3197 RepID=A0A2R6X8D1_MARPO|nr:hypothetical protein MARPO_0030s0093 [Marchantia polymorpha]BBN20239.1 hypothetical protein Mp_8g17590 [Marchantia polymorpha subsp. ruderalis]|eukprot:PTQ42357.1 hypothetical protein MARPO_0030s0093 [Marchantia polymorpha]
MTIQSECRSIFSLFVRWRLLHGLLNYERLLAGILHFSASRFCSGVSISTAMGSRNDSFCECIYTLHEQMLACSHQEGK